MGCCSSAPIEPSLIQQISLNSDNTSQETITHNYKRSKKLPDVTTTPPVHVTAWPSPPTQSIPGPSKPKHFNESSHSTDDFFNVLLLGESGVGKSTFINALVNYLTFDTLEQARSGKPIALMPVSFPMTVGDDFQEQIIRFGDEDPNEDHEHPGQSVTQNCKSYVFTVGTQHMLKLIDTPGMGDTRGLDQDDFNMQHILSFINNLSHLNAICILLKPNESRLNVVLRSYFTRLISFLGENVRNNIIFCFTNTRATFFSPGNTGPLLKQMLGNFPIEHIPFNKSNTFCFDSESFRYLIALENGIKFDDYQKEEYNQSWVSSVNESNRLLQYICSGLKSYPQKNWRSTEHVQFQINKMIRPILETTRNIFRNIILTTENSLKPQIGLYLTALFPSSTICDKCKRNPQRYSDFWILPDEVHLYIDKCARCTCSRTRHIHVGYELHYKLLDDTNKQSIDEMYRNLDQLKHTILEFGYFFLHITRTSNPKDPVLSFLNQIIEEENQICQEKGTECLNSILHKQLNQFKEEYEQRQSTLLTNRNPIDLASFYELIKSVNGMDLIRKQMDVSY